MTRLSKPASVPHPPRPTPPKEATFLGLALAPIPPKRRREGLRDKQSRGLALLMVLSLLALATTLTMELQFDSNVQLQMAANSRDALQAEYLARSALQFTHLLLAFDTQFNRMKGQIEPYLKMAPPEMKMLFNRFQVWRIVPLNSDLLKSIASGTFSSPKEEKTPPQEGEIKGKLFPFGDFLGRFSATLEEESSKLNLNRFTDFSDAQVLRSQLTALFLPQRYDPLFERRRPDGTFVTRQEQIAAIQDWVDGDDQVFGEGGSSEDSKYRYQDKGYVTKNSYFDSIEELRLVYGVDDLFFQTFGHMFTVYGPRLRINIRDADINQLLGLVMNYGTPVPPATKEVFLQPQFQIMYRQAMETWRNYVGFNTVEEFFNWVEQPNVLPAQYTQLLGSSGQQQPVIYPDQLPRFRMKRNTSPLVLATTADTFQVEAVGEVGRVRRRITAVIHVQERGARQVYYWRLH